MITKQRNLSAHNLGWWRSQDLFVNQKAWATCECWQCFPLSPFPVRANYHVILPDFIHANEFQDFGARPNANWGYTGRMKMYRRLTQSHGKLPAYTWWSSHLCAWLMQVHYTHCTSSICMVEWLSTILYTPVYTRWNGTTNVYKYVYTEVTERGTDKISNTQYYVHTCKFTQKHRTMNHRMFFHHYQHPGNETPCPTRVMLLMQ